MMERDYFLDAEQALEMGLVDKVLTTREEQEKVLQPLNKETKESKDTEENKTENGKGSDGDDDGQPPSPAPNPSLP
jgi:virulence-associated protein VagC